MSKTAFPLHFSARLRGEQSYPSQIVEGLIRCDGEIVCEAARERLDHEDQRVADAARSDVVTAAQATVEDLDLGDDDVQAIVDRLRLAN